MNIISKENNHDHCVVELPVHCLFNHVLMLTGILLIISAFFDIYHHEFVLKSEVNMYCINSSTVTSHLWVYMLP